MLLTIEEKRFNGKLRWSQEQQFKRLHNAVQYDPLYCGFFVIVFENTSPDDGCTYLNGKIITKEILIEFLRFKFPVNSYFVKEGS